ncbi:hypothetical protein D3C71_2087640 [compost metagenome]
MTGKGKAKLQEAIDYVNKRTSEYGINVSLLTIQATVEKAVLDFNAVKKPYASELLPAFGINGELLDTPEGEK